LWLQRSSQNAALAAIYHNLWSQRIIP
jgi:hypothetical protein